MSRRPPPGLEDYLRTARERCFICAIASGEDVRHHVIYEDGGAIAFLNRFPTLEGYTIVAPRAHREQVTGDVTSEEYVALQRVVYGVAEGVRAVLEPERSTSSASAARPRTRMCTGTWRRCRRVFPSRSSSSKRSPGSAGSSSSPTRTRLPWQIG